MEFGISSLQKYEKKTGKTPPEVMIYGDCSNFISDASVIEYGLMATANRNRIRQLEGQKTLPKDFAYEEFLGIKKQIAEEIRRENREVLYGEDNFRTIKPKDKDG